MKLTYKIKGFCFALTLILLNPTYNFAQSDQFDLILESGVEDAETLLGHYLKPAVKGFGYDINAGWFNTAKPHKTLGFDLTVMGHAALVPNKDVTFTFNDHEYANIRLSDPSNRELPTLFGEYEAGPELIIMEDGEEVVRVSSMPGLGLKEDIGYNAVPAPMVQLGLGITKGTDVKLRFFPHSVFGDTDVKLLGIGVMHDIKQWIPGMKELPMELSVFGGFTKMSSNSYLNDAKTQQLTYDVTGISFQAIASKKLAIFTFYGGLGYNTVNSNVNLLGDFETDKATFKDPVTLNYKHGSPRATFGMNIHAGPLLIMGDYSFNEYNNVTLGVGFAVR